MLFFILLVGLFISLPLWAEAKITSEVILELLGQEKRFMQERDVLSLSSLFTEDAVFVYENGEKLDKSQYIAITARVFMDTEAILVKPELLSEKISDDGMSAEVQVRSIEKYLLLRGRQKAVSTSVNVWRAIVVVEEGGAKYRYSEIIGQE